VLICRAFLCADICRVFHALVCVLCGCCDITYAPYAVRPANSELWAGVIPRTFFLAWSTSLCVMRVWWYLSASVSVICICRVRVSAVCCICAATYCRYFRSGDLRDSSSSTPFSLCLAPLERTPHIACCVLSCTCMVMCRSKSSSSIEIS